jgi:hypothetical protein
MVAPLVVEVELPHVGNNNYALRDFTETAAIFADTASPTAQAAALIWQVRQNFERQHESGRLALATLARTIA